MSVTVSVSDPGGVQWVKLHYDNGSGPQSLQMEMGSSYVAQISQSVAGSVVFWINATDDDGNFAVRASFNITWSEIATTTTTTTTTTITTTTTTSETSTTTTTTTTTTPTIPEGMDPLIIYGAIAIGVVVIVIILIVLRKK